MAVVCLDGVLVHLIAEQLLLLDDGSDVLDGEHAQLVSFAEALLALLQVDQVLRKVVPLHLEHVVLEVFLVAIQDVLRLLDWQSFLDYLVELQKAVML